MLRFASRDDADSAARSCRKRSREGVSRAGDRCGDHRRAMWEGPVQPEREPLRGNSGGTAGAAPLVPMIRDEGAFFVPGVGLSEGEASVGGRSWRKRNAKPIT